MVIVFKTKWEQGSANIFNLLFYDGKEKGYREISMIYFRLYFQTRRIMFRPREQQH